MNSGLDTASDAQGRTLVLCFDGTSNEYGTQVSPSFVEKAVSVIISKNTNVVKFFEVLDRANTDKQMVYYQVRLDCSLPTIYT